MLKSLRARLFLSLTAVIVATGLAGGWFAYAWAYNEAIETQDSVLIQIGTFASSLPTMPSEPVKGIDAEAEVSIVELGSTPRGKVDDRRLWALHDGLGNETRDGKPIRAFLRTRADGSRFAVTQRTEIRDEIAGDMAVRTLLPIAALVPCLLIVTALVIAYSFKPMVRLASELDTRKQDDLAELSIHDAPSELSPFLNSINGLLRRMQTMMDQQRRFIADAAHELRTPITALSVQAANLGPFEMSSEARGRLEALKDGMRRTRHLLEQLLALARQEAPQQATQSTVSLDRVVKEVVADLLPDATARNVDLGFAVVEEIGVLGDHTSLTSLVRNLVENAVKFTPDGGRIDLGIFRENDAALLQIEDTGPGIPPGELDRVFEPFFRGRAPTQEGSGLGLSIAKRSVDRLGGSIRFENIDMDGRTGLRVIVRLPMVA